MGEEIAHRLPTDAERADAPALIRPEVRSWPRSRTPLVSMGLRVLRPTASFRVGLT